MQWNVSVEIMSFLKKIGDLFGNDRKLERTFLDGMDYYSRKEYSLAYKNFMNVYKKTRSNKIKLHSLLNASTSAENLNENGDASSLLVTAAKLKCQLRDPAKEIAETLEKAYNLMTKDNKKVDYDNLYEIIAPLMIFKIAVHDRNFINKLASNLSESEIKHPHNKFALDTYSNFVNHPEKIWETENFIIFPDQFPKEFTSYVRSVQDVIRGSSALTIALSSNISEIKTGEQISIKSKIINHTPLLIEKLYLQPGSKGQFIHTSYDAKKVNLPDKQTNIEYDFTLEPHLTGNWVIGPLTVSYLVNGASYEAKSDTLKINVIPGSKELTLDIDYNVIEEDFEFEFISKIENSGETPLENIKIQLKIPSAGKFTEGTPERSIFELRNGEKIEFSNRVKFEAGTLGKTYKIKLLAKFDGTDHEKELILTSGVKSSD